MMGWLRISLSADEQHVVIDNRETHSSLLVRRRLLVLWSLHCGLTRQQAADVAGIGLATVQRFVSIYRTDAIDGLLKPERTYVPVSELAQFESVIRKSFEEQPARSIVEACARIKELTGLERAPTQVRVFLKGIGLKWQRIRAIRVPPKKVLKNTLPSRQTSVNTETMCELMRKIAAQNLVGPITLVLDNARYQRNAAVFALAGELKITLMFLPSYSPNLNLIERLWKFTKRRSLYGRYHSSFAEFRQAIEETLNQIPTTHANDLKKLMTLNFQRFQKLSLLAA
jgi:transposase